MWDIMMEIKSVIIDIQAVYILHTVIIKSTKLDSLFSHCSGLLFLSSWDLHQAVICQMKTFIWYQVVSVQVYCFDISIYWRIIGELLSGKV